MRLVNWLVTTVCGVPMPTSGGPVDRNAYVRTKDNRVAARDKKTGEVRFTSQRRDFTVFGTNPKEDGIIYAGTKGGRVVAIRPVLKPGSVGEVVMVGSDE